MTTDVPYHPTLEKGEVLENLQKESGKQFNPEIIEAFLHTNRIDQEEAL